MGKFIGKVKTAWLHQKSEDINMKLLEELIYVDDNGAEWIAPKGSVINGASIPRIFWTIIGSPFTGDYRVASIIHDVYCQNKNKPSKKVHKVFEEMLVTLNVSVIKRTIMAFCVKTFGPRW